MKRFVFLLFLIGAAVGGWYYWKTVAPAREQAAPVFYGNIDIREVRLGFRVAGKVLEVLKEEGDEVQAGEVVARLDAEPYQNALAQAQAQVGMMESRLLELQNGSRPEEIEQARKNLGAAEAALENTRLIYERQQRLVTSGSVSRQDFDTARSSYQAARARRDEAKAFLNLVLTGARSEHIVQAEANLAAARAALAQTQTQLNDTRLVAPEAGVVLTRAVEPGAMVQAGGAALTLNLSAPIRVRAYVPEPQFGQIYPGREVLVFTGSRAEPYHAQVGDVSPRAEFTPKSVETEELRTALVYRFHATVRDSDQGLRQGMPVTLRLVE